ncbi:MAG TPA: ABC transporter permease [Gemmatimonadaceae bacterium]|jgi:ABC-2 type transport system permease protein|nr:ABC transporter permease [Gemmatimonadaceae bacterium]
MRAVRRMADRAVASWPGATRIWQMVLKEFRQIFRDPRMSRVIFVTPILQLMLFGYAVSTDVRNMSTFIVDHDGTRASRELVAAFTSSGYFRLAGRSDQPAALVRALDRGDAMVGLEIPRGFAEALRSGEPARVQLLLDGTNSNTATVAQSYAERIALGYGIRLGVARRPVGVPEVDLRERAWFNPELASRDYNVPAVIGAIMLLVALLLTSLAVVREREIGTLEQLRVSPLTPGELIAGKTIPFAIIGFADMMVVTLIAILWFGVPFAGSAALLLLAGLLYLLAALGIGLLISTLAATQQEAFMVSFLVYMPAILLSGFMFPVSSMPRLFQWLTYANPMRHFLEIVRGLFLKGVGLESVWMQYLVLGVMGAGLLVVAAARFRRATT